MRYPDDDLLEEAIDQARDLAHTSRDIPLAEQQYRLMVWLEELRDRRGRSVWGRLRRALRQGTQP